MNGKELDSANGRLGQQPQKKSRVWLWIILGIILGIALLVLGFIIYYWWDINYGPKSRYPYMIVPKNTVRSHSGGELLANLVLDMNDTANEYAVYKRPNGGLL